MKNTLSDSHDRLIDIVSESNCLSGPVTGYIMASSYHDSNRLFIICILHVRGDCSSTKKASGHGKTFLEDEVYVYNLYNSVDEIIAILYKW